MEKSVEWQFEAAMQEIFQLREVEIQEYSPSYTGLYRGRDL